MRNSELQKALADYDRKGRGLNVLPASEMKPIIDAARKVANAERIWICEYPEFADPGCLEQHDPEQTRQSRKHSECRWVLAITEAPDAGQ